MKIKEKKKKKKKSKRIYASVRGKKRIVVEKTDGQRLSANLAS